MYQIPNTNVYYCKQCNVPVLINEKDLNKKCSLCNSELKYISTDIRPVYPEERLMLECALGEPLKYLKSSIWNVTGNRYCIDGEILKLSVKELTSKDSDRIRKLIKKYESQNSYKYFESYIKTYLEVNKYRLNLITDEACSYIQEVASGYSMDSMFVSFSGGKDSTVVSDLAIKALGTNGILHIFGDTTLELESTYRYIEEFKNKYSNILLRNVRNKEKDFFELTKNNFGPPSRVMRWCCTIFKTGPISRKIDALFKKKKEVLTFYGIRRSESVVRSKYERDYESPKISKQRVVGPIIDWKDSDVWLYILANDLLINDAYRYGYSRVGCWCCPNNSSWSEFMSKVYEPERYVEWRSILIDFAKKVGKPDPEDYIDEGGWKARQGGNGLDVSHTKISSQYCTTQENAKVYDLKRPIQNDLYELFKPFGLIDKESGRKFIDEILVKDKKTNEPIISLQGAIGNNKLKVVILKSNNPSLFEKRIECQITKYQVCMGCLACESICKYDAISIRDNKYKINEKKCALCLECVAHFTHGCYVKKVLYTKKQEV